MLLLRFYPVTLFYKFLRFTKEKIKTLILRSIMKLQTFDVGHILLLFRNQLFSYYLKVIIPNSALSILFIFPEVQIRGHSQVSSYKNYLQRLQQNARIRPKKGHVI